MDLCLQEFRLEASDDELEVLASPCGEAVVVMKKEEPPSSLSSPLPVRRSPTTPTAQKDTEGNFLFRVKFSQLSQLPVTVIDSCLFKVSWYVD